VLRRTWRYTAWFSLCLCARYGTLWACRHRSRHSSDWCSCRPKSGEHCANRDFGARLHEELLNHASLKDLDIDNALFRLHHGDDIAALDVRARLDMPLHERAGFHISAQTGHAEFSHWRAPFS
jgi:hypothetical protein